MKCLSFLLPALFLCLPLAAWSAEKDDNKLAEGTWLPTEAELAGEKFPDAVLKSMKLVLKEGKYTVTVGERLDKGTVKIDPKAKPKTLDIVGTDGPNKGKTILAIYELTEDTMRICYDLEGKKHPTEFKTEKDSKLFLVTYNRMKD